jgi:hypothetical protein
VFECYNREQQPPVAAQIHCRDQSFGHEIANKPGAQRKEVGGLVKVYGQPAIRSF